MKHGSLFSGIGGFDLAAEAMGWENLFHCEWNPFGQRILKYYWPEAESFSDITKTDFKKYANTIDILTGGFPCQPFSVAGLQKGTEDERHLWPEMLRSIREIQPRWVVGENVFGLINWNGGLVFHQVQTDLEAEGYEVFPYVLPACSKNAPHRRERVWFVAHSNHSRCRQGNKEVPGRLSEQPNSLCFQRDDSNPNGGNVQGIQDKGTASGNRPDRKERFAGIFRNEWDQWPTEPPICFGDDGLSTRLDNSSISFAGWRRESIKAGGNAIVPQVAFEIFKAIAAYDKLYNNL